MNARNVYIWIAHFIDTSRLEVATPSYYSESCWESLIKFVTRESSLTREPAVNTKNIPEKYYNWLNPLNIPVGWN